MGAANITSAIVPTANAESLSSLAPEALLPPVEATTPSAGSRVAFGIYQPTLPDDLSSLTVYEASAGKPMPIIAWYALWGGWKSAFSADDLRRVVAHGSEPLITWEPWSGQDNDPNWTLQRAILSGRSDTYIRSWARGLATFGKPVLLRFAHEPNGAQYPWTVGVNGNTATQYRDAWRHVQKIFNQEGATNVQWVWSPNVLGDTSADAYAPIWGPIYPDGSRVDWVGLDLFNTGPNLSWGAAYWRTFDQVLQSPYAAATAVSTKPILITELGSTETGGNKARWITVGLGESLASYPRVRAVVWFDVNKEKEQDWRLSSSPTALQAWLDILRGKVFGTKEEPQTGNDRDDDLSANTAASA